MTWEQFLLWPIDACFEAADELNAGMGKDVSGMLIVILLVATLAAVIAIGRVPMLWPVVLVVYLVLYCLLGAGHTLASRA